MSLEEVSALTEQNHMAHRGADIVQGRARHHQNIYVNGNEDFVNDSQARFRKYPMNIRNAPVNGIFDRQHRAINGTRIHLIHRIFESCARHNFPTRPSDAACFVRVGARLALKSDLALRAVRHPLDPANLVPMVLDKPNWNAIEGMRINLRPKLR